MRCELSISVCVCVCVCYTGSDPLHSEYVAVGVWNRTVQLYKIQVHRYTHAHAHTHARTGKCTYTYRVASRLSEGLL